MYRCAWLQFSLTCKLQEGSQISCFSLRSMDSGCGSQSPFSASAQCAMCSDLWQVRAGA